MRDRRHLPALSQDLELRPRKAEPATTARLLAPKLRRFAEDIDTASEAFRTLLQDAQAHACPTCKRTYDPIQAGAAAAKLAEVAHRALALASSQQQKDPHALRSQEDVPQWEKLSPEAQERVGAALDVLSSELGEGWAG